MGAKRRVVEGAAVNSYDEWTRANIGEVVPERMTPFSFAVWSEPMNRLLALSFRHFRLDTDAVRFIRSEDGWLTYNIGAVNHLAAEIGLPPMDAAVGSAAGPAAHGGGLRPRRLIRHAGGLVRSTWGQVRLGRRFADARVHAREIAGRYRARGERVEDPARLIELAYEAYGELEQFLALYADATAAAFSTYVLLERAASRLAPGVNAAGLLHSPGVSVTQISNAVLSAAREAAAGDGIAIDTFIREFGHRGWQELELSNASWRSDPSAVLAAASRYRESPAVATHQPEPAAVFGWRGLVLRAIAARTGEYAAIRENVKHEFYRPIDSIRELVQKAAARLEDAGRLDARRDMFFLVPDELEELLRTDDPAALRATAAARRAAWDGRAPAIDAGDGAGVSVSRLHGVGASAGEAIGTARVLSSPGEADRLAPGDILVVAALDIGWTPVFALVGGIVTSIGGVLSHACTVARELGVPVVAGVGSCQSLIRDGERVNIDGQLGHVDLLGMGAEASAASQAPGRV